MSSTYRFSALAFGLARMWRAWRVMIPVVLLNAVLQALLQWPPFTYGTGWLTVLTALLSAIVFAVSFGVLAAAALLVPQGAVRWHEVIVMFRTRAAHYVVWVVVWLVLVWLGTLLTPIGGLVIAALTPFLLFAALEGQRNPIAVDLRVIGRRFWRWLVTCLIVGAGLILGSIIGGFTMFFLRPPLGVLIAWLIGGLLAWWVTTTWALIYRSVIPAAKEASRESVEAATS
jgi:hypothetical protein